jgi:dehydrogenase/reductase SDR family protein 12
MDTIRKLSFSIKGYRNFRKGNFISTSQNFNKEALEVDISTRVYLISGANSGLGFATALEIAKRGGIVHMLCRDAERGKVALDKIIAATKSDKVKLYRCDISSQKSIREFVKKYVAEETKLDVLINNAGAMFSKNDKTEEGLPINFATNTLGTFLLTELLIPFMQSTKGKFRSRVITVSSGGMYTQKLTPDYMIEKMNPYDGVDAYAITKRHQVILNECWSIKYPEVGFYAMHPGWADTEGVQGSLPGFRKYFETTLRTPEEGADTIVWLGIAKENELDSQTGKFYFDREIADTHMTLAGTQETEDERSKFYDFLSNTTKLGH